MNVLVAGAAGSLGRVVIDALVERGHSVRAVIRNTPIPDELAGVTTHEADALDVSRLVGACDGIDVVFSSLGASVIPIWGKGRKGFTSVDTPANRNLIAAARQAGVKRFVYVGVAGSRDLGRLDYVRAHELVVTTLEKSGLDYAVIRPTGLFSAFAVLLPMAARGPLPLIGDGRARTNPIHDEDVAGMCVEAIEGLTREKEMEVGGPEIFTRKEIMQMASEAVGCPLRLRRVPVAVARISSLFLRPLNPRLSQLTAFYATVWTHDLVAPSVGTQRLSEFFAKAAGDV